MTSSGKLQVTTPGERELALTRVFAAPRELVFDAWTKPELMRRWLGPPGWTLAVAEIDPRAGGSYRLVMRGPDGTEMGWGGKYLEVAQPERLVATERFDQPWYPGEAVVSTVLVEQEGRTTATSTIRYESRAARDTVLASPMEQGLAASYERMDELLAQLRREPRAG